MEKIYMGDNNNSPQKQLSSKYHVSIVLSFIVAIFAIVSLIAVGFNQVSYAAPDDTAGAPAKITPVQFGIKEKKDATSFQTRSIFVTSYADNKSFNYEIMYEDKGSFDSATEGNIIDDINDINILFCYGNHNDEAGFNSEYSDGGIIDDAGLAYILNRSGITGNAVGAGISGLAPGLTNFRYLEAYATQVAIWSYLGRTTCTSWDTESGNCTGTSKVSEVAQVTNPTGYKLLPEGPVTTSYPDFNKIITDDANPGNPIGSMYGSINNIVREAGYAKESGSSSAPINVNVPNDVSKVSGTNYYQSEEISVSAADLISFNIELSGIDGAFIVNSAGEEIKNLNGLPADTKFFVRFPEDKIGEKKDIVIKVTGEVRNVAVPHVYLLDGHQSIIKVEKGTGPASGSGVLTVVTPPDTGASTSQTIYFIGLIVLLCGVGIIYANSKAVKGA